MRGHVFGTSSRVGQVENLTHLLTLWVQKQVIRKYKDKDLKELLDAWEQASRLAHPFLDDAFFAAERTAIPDVYIPVAETWVFEREGQVVGFVSMLGNEVGGLFVMPSVHGQGIGRSLMDHVSKSRDFLEVDVFEQNHVGRKFYDRYGFNRVREHTHDQTGHLLLRMELRPP